MLCPAWGVAGAPPPNGTWPGAVPGFNFVCNSRDLNMLQIAAMCCATWAPSRSRRSGEPRPAAQHDLPLKSGKVELKQEMNSTPIRTRDLHNKENNNLHRNQNMQRRPTQEP